jgi:hypothetical protein
MTWEDGRMENLFEQMVEEAVVDVWKAEAWEVFLDVAAAGWGLLKVRLKYGGEREKTDDLAATCQ